MRGNTFSKYKCLTHANPYDTDRNYFYYTPLGIDLNKLLDCWFRNSRSMSSRTIVNHKWENRNEAIALTIFYRNCDISDRANSVTLLFPLLQKRFKIVPYSVQRFL
jgi:hypothetical protein